MVRHYGGAGAGAPSSPGWGRASGSGGHRSSHSNRRGGEDQRGDHHGRPDWDRDRGSNRPNGASPDRGRPDSRSRRRLSPARRRGSPSRRHGSPSRRHESPPRRRESPSRRRESPSRRRESPSRRRESPSRRHESPSRRHESPSRRHGSPTERHARRRRSPSWRGDASPSALEGDAATESRGGSRGSPSRHEEYSAAKRVRRSPSPPPAPRRRFLPSCVVRVAPALPEPTALQRRLQDLAAPSASLVSSEYPDDDEEDDDAVDLFVEDLRVTIRRSLTPPPSLTSQVRRERVAQGVRGQTNADAERFRLAMNISARPRASTAPRASRPRRPKCAPAKGFARSGRRERGVGGGLWASPDPVVSSAAAAFMHRLEANAAAAKERLRETVRDMPWS